MVTFLSGGTVALYVSSNQNKTQYRLWRQTADGSNEWSDQFVFSAFIKPTGNFTFPLYVFAAGGSPYWRQYVSANSVPPSPEYRLDYMFHASTTSFPGALQCFVLDAGSIPVIRSRVSTSKNVPGWKDKGLSFFALKVEKTSRLIQCFLYCLCSLEIIRERSFTMKRRTAYTKMPCMIIEGLVTTFC